MGPILNSYPDSIGSTFKEINKILDLKEFKNVFSSYYILPSIFHTDLDRGFSVQDYGLEESLITQDDLNNLKDKNMTLILDIVLNHLSVLSPEFQDLIKNGNHSKYKDFFIDWNTFWKDKGKLSKEGYIIPDKQYTDPMFFRKPGLPVMMVEYENGQRVPYWNTFYSEERIIDGKKQYLGQMDLNINSPLVWQYYKETLHQLKEYGASIIRLDAFGYASKIVGRANFLNDPETWDILDKINALAKEEGLSLLPEIHASYKEGIYKQIAVKGYYVYDFFLPGLILYTLHFKDATYLISWIQEITNHHYKTINMLGCHDGIPMLDLKGLLPDDLIQETIDHLVENGGYVKNLEGNKKMYYQVNETYFSALDEREDLLLLSRAIQVFTPGIPQVWYLDLFAGKNNLEALTIGHKEINRTNLTVEEVKDGLNNEVVYKQLELLRLRNTHPVFLNPTYSIYKTNEGFNITVRNENNCLTLKVNLQNDQFEIIDN